ncbi:ABC transporter permease [Streptomyces sp. B1866]|uniref:ABC transporter permease n=1 Tax=Streptomyces sp. B1866 TaxID=3075431 RepID=UPI0028928346|nr:ABC transporter permease [Streptomyces sp. B1866]MDT3399756.1 ABC transporter permease [Streptomyces sp. B1866]
MTATASPARVATHRRGSSRDLAGTAVLLRLALRRDRIMLPAWVLVLGLAVSSVASSIKNMYGTAAERADLARDMLANGSTRALYGPVFSDSVGGLTAWRMGAFAPALAAVMSLLLVVRHTREEEETGRQEVLSSGTVGRRAGLTSALTIALAANAGVALLVMAGLAGAGEGGTGAVALGLAIGLTGLAFAGLAAVAAQLTDNARLAKGLTAAVLGVAFVLRMAGDAAKNAAEGSSHWLVWASPLGWAENVRPYAGERWWPLALVAVLAAAGVTAAYALAGRRDLGGGYLPDRPGPAGAGPLLHGPYGLAWRLQRGALLGWAAGLVFAGAVFGGISKDAEDIIGDSGRTRDIFERMGGHQGVTDSFLAAMVDMLGLVCLVYAVSAVLRLRGEETGNRAEPLLAGPVGRLRWAGGHLLAAYLGSALVLALGGLATGVSYGLATDDLAGQVPRLVAAGLAQVPAVWVVTSAAVFLVGALPRLSGAAWGLVGAALAIGWLGPAVDLPQWAMDLSPFSHLPDLPGGEVSAVPFAWLAAVIAVAAGAGLAGLRRRDFGA